jgi:hypothetical protein
MIVYTAITGGKDSLKEDQVTGEAKFVAFLENGADSDTWEVREATMDNPDPNRCAKKYKVKPHEYFPNEEYSLWIDGTITLLEPPESLIDKYLKDHDIALHKHYMRKCAYEEAVACGSLNLDDQETISKQMAKYYIREGYPRNNGLAECTIILRRHTPKIEELNNLWWEEISNGSRRDQLSFNYCCWKLGIEYNKMEGTVYNSPHFGYTRHLK